MEMLLAAGGNGGGPQAEGGGNRRGRSGGGRARPCHRRNYCQCKGGDGHSKPPAQQVKEPTWCSFYLVVALSAQKPNLVELLERAVQNILCTTWWGKSDDGAIIKFYALRFGKSTGELYTIAVAALVTLGGSRVTNEAQLSTERTKWCGVSYLRYIAGGAMRRRYGQTCRHWTCTLSPYPVWLHRDCRQYRGDLLRRARRPGRAAVGRGVEQAVVIRRHELRAGGR